MTIRCPNCYLEPSECECHQTTKPASGSRLFSFDGDTYEHEEDHARLSGQMLRVYHVMRDGQWHSLSELASRTGGSEAGVSARLRDLRKEKFGGWSVNRKRGNQSGLWLYQLEITT